MKRIRIEDRLLMVVLIAQLVLVCTGVVSRYLFSWSLSFTEELTRYSLIWLACFGMSACYAENELIRFQWLYQKFPIITFLQRWIFIGIHSLFLASLFISSIKMIQLQIQFKQTTSVMGWPIAWISTALPLFCLLVLFRIIFHYIRT